MIKIDKLHSKEKTLECQNRIDFEDGTYFYEESDDHFKERIKKNLGKLNV
jgi:hypothetical protein